jgi:hypothetical protein
MRIETIRFRCIGMGRGLPEGKSALAAAICRELMELAATLLFSSRFRFLLSRFETGSRRVWNRLRLEGRTVSEETPEPPEPPEQKPGQQKDDEKAQEVTGLWRFFGLGIQLAVTVALFAALGYWVDAKFGWAPWGLLVCSLVGVSAGMYHFLKAVLQ